MRLNGSVIFVFLFCYLSELGYCTKEENNVNTDDKELETRRVEGNAIIQLATKLNSPLLKLLGASVMSQKDKLDSVDDKIAFVRKEITNLSTNTDIIVKAVQTKVETMEFNLTNILENICQTKSCSEWTEWTACETVKASDFGTQNRSRKCGFRNKICEGVVSVNTSEQIEMQLCVRSTTTNKISSHGNRCPSDYVTTPHGYCVKINIGSWLRENASVLCNKEGGHLLHVDSNNKRQDIKELLVNHTSKYFWVDGIKTNSGGEWLFRNGTSKSTITFWAASHPNQKNFPVCVYLIYENSQWYWKDYNCRGGTADTICEIIYSL